MNNKFQILHQYNKKKLVPFGEFLPFEKVLTKFGLKKITEGHGSFLKGDIQKNIIVETFDGLILNLDLLNVDKKQYTIEVLHSFINSALQPENPRHTTLEGVFTFYNIKDGPSPLTLNSKDKCCHSYVLP